MQIYLLKREKKKPAKRILKVVVPKVFTCPQNGIYSNKQPFLLIKRAILKKVFVSLQSIYNNTRMEYQSLNESARMMANDRKRSIYINKVESGLPRWLIEIGFVCFLIQAFNTACDISEWVTANGLQAPIWLIVLAGDMILYYAMMRGMKPLVRPFTVLWWIFMVVVAAGDITSMLPESVVDLALAVALPLVFLPLGISIAFFYRGWLQWVGILMVAHMVTMIIFPIMLYDLIPYVIVDIIGIAVVIALGWTMRKVLV